MNSDKKLKQTLKQVSGNDFKIGLLFFLAVFTLGIITTVIVSSSNKETPAPVATSKVGTLLVGPPVSLATIAPVIPDEALEREKRIERENIAVYISLLLFLLIAVMGGAKTDGGL